MRSDTDWSAAILLDFRPCNVNTADELDCEIKDIFALDNLGRGEMIGGTLHVYYSDESVMRATLLSALKGRGVHVEWHKR